MSSSAAAAEAAAVVPFHCIVCFEEFDLNDRFPVILPCGHTYVCSVCSKRLTKCMECRIPLFWTPPPAASNKTTVTFSSASNSTSRTTSAGVLSYRTSGRYRTVSPPSSPGGRGRGGATSPRAEPVALPLPKNVVLMTLMEANERQASLLSRQAQHEKGDEEDAASPEAADAEIDRIIVGMEALSGPCGTYSVKEVEGLAVLPLDPRKGRNVDHVDDAEGNTEVRLGSRPPDSTDEEEGPTFDEKDRRRGKWPFRGGGGSSAVGETTTTTEEESREPFMIQMGQTVQVVDVKDGVAKLARDMGYIVATPTQLVKVGGPMEKTCKLEGMLDLVQMREKELQKKMNQLERLEIGLHSQIKEEQIHEPSYPIITPVPEELPSTSLMDQTAETISPQGSPEDSPASSPVSQTRIAKTHPTTLSAISPQTPQELTGGREVSDAFCANLVSPFYGDGRSRTKRPPKHEMGTPSPPTIAEQFASPNTIDNSDIGLNMFVEDSFPPSIPLHRREDSDPDLVQVGCSALFGPRYCDDGSTLGLAMDGISNENHTVSSDEHTLDENTIAESVGGQSAATTGRATTRRRPRLTLPSPILNASFDSVDFRTGLSGHRALSNKTADQRAVLTNRGEIRMMGEHRGLGKARGRTARRSVPQHE